jgi:hypothetical protein
MRFSIKEGRAWGMKNLFRLKRTKGMQPQYEVNNFSIVTLLSKVEFFSLSTVWIWPIYSLQMELKGRFEMFPVYRRSRIMDLVT